jgi:hypothetical protein
MSKRPTLDSLSSRFARKDAPAEPAAAAAAPTPEPTVVEPEPAPAAARAPKREQRVQILTRIDAPTRKRLKLIAVEQDRTIQE